MNTLKCALNSALNEHAEASRVHQDPGTDLQPSELRDNQETAQTGVEDNGAERGTPPTAAASSQEPRPPPREQQPPRHACQQENLRASITTSVRELPGERSTSNNARGARSTKRAAGASTLAATNFEQPDDAADVPLHDAHGTRGMMRGQATAAKMAPPPGGDAHIVESNPRPLSEQIVRKREIPQHPEPVLRLPEALSPRAAQPDKIGQLGRDPAETRPVADAATESRRRAEGRVAALEEVIAESERQHELFRERGEARLETLKREFAQEQEEGGAQVRRETAWFLSL